MILRKPGYIHPRHVETDEEFEGKTGSLGGIEAVINTVDLPVLQAHIEGKPITRSRGSYVRHLGCANSVASRGTHNPLA